MRGRTRGRTRRVSIICLTFTPRVHFLPRSTAARRCLVSSCSVLTLPPNESLAPLLPITMTKHYAPERDQTRGRTAGNSGNTVWEERGVIQATWDVTDETTAHVSKSVYSRFMSLPYSPWLIVGATQAEPNCREARKVRKSRRQEDLHLRTHASGLVNVTRGACDHRAQAKKGALQGNTDQRFGLVRSC